MSALEVWVDHKVVQTYPAEYGHTVDGDDLLVFRWVNDPATNKPTAEIVKRWPSGSWHGAGVDMLCAFKEPKDDCPNCYGAMPIPRSVLDQPK